MVVADIARAALLVSIPLAFAFDVLSLEQLYVVVFLVGSCAVFFDLSYSSFFTATVPREQVLAANGRLSTSRAVAYVAGPSLAGLLVQLADGAGRDPRRRALVRRFGVCSFAERGWTSPSSESRGVSALRSTKEGHPHPRAPPAAPRTASAARRP